MKKRKLLVLLASLLLVTSCSGKGTSEEVSSLVISSEDPSSEIVSSSERQYEDVDWNDETMENIKSIVGDNVIPYYKTRVHESTVGEESNTKYVKITAKGAGSSATDTYTTLLKNAGYKTSVTDSAYIGYKDVSVTDTMYIQYSLTEDNDLEIYAYIVTERTTTWPKESIKTICGGDVPAVPAVSYYLAIGAAANGNYDISGYCYGCASTIEEDYAKILENAGFSVTNNSGFYIADDATTKVRVWFYKEYDDSFYISMFSTEVNTNFPSEEIKLIIDEYLPVCSFDGVEYSQSNVTTSSGYTAYTVYCDNASEKDFEAYRDLLVTNGWDTTYSSANEKYLSYSFEKTNDEGDHEIQIIYSIEQKCIAIAVYC